MKTLNELFRDIICLNEGGTAVAYEFSDPDGIRSGKSGWSFGVCQWDTRNNGTALKCLTECGFTLDEIHGIIDQTIDVRPFSARLAAHRDVIEKYDERQLQHCLDQAVDFNNAHEIPVTETAALLAQADYCNQYGSMGGECAAYLAGLGRPVAARDILQFKLDHTQFGKNHPKDCERRYDNIMKVVHHG
jgi:hypothetical protein